MNRNSTLKDLPFAKRYTLLVLSMYIIQSTYNVLLSTKNMISFTSNNPR